MDNISKLQDLIDSSGRIVFFGGAGVSTESGIPDFRSAGGIYSRQSRIPPEVILSHEFFCEHVEMFFDFYKKNLVFPDARPNAAHIRLAELEAAGRLSGVITQNIDSLHTMAGSKNVCELHGSVKRNHCVKCGKFYSEEFVLSATGVPLCTECGGTVKPDVVLYDEQLDQEVISRSLKLLERADLLIVGGTSLRVYPAAGLIECYRGGKVVLINKSPTRLDGGADLLISDGIASVFSQIRV